MIDYYEYLKSIPLFNFNSSLLKMMQQEINSILENSNLMFYDWGTHNELIKVESEREEKIFLNNVLNLDKILNNESKNLILKTTSNLSFMFKKEDSFVYYFIEEIDQTKLIRRNHFKFKQNHFYISHFPDLIYFDIISSNIVLDDNGSFHMMKSYDNLIEENFEMMMFAHIKALSYLKDYRFILNGNIKKYNEMNYGLESRLVMNQFSLFVN